MDPQLVWANITNCVYIKAFGIYSSVHFIVLRQDLLKSFVASFYGKTNKTHSNGLQKFQYAPDMLIEPSNQKLSQRIRWDYWCGRPRPLSSCSQLASFSLGQNAVRFKPKVYYSFRRAVFVSVIRCAWTFGGTRRRCCRCYC